MFIKRKSSNGSVRAILKIWGVNKQLWKIWGMFVIITIWSNYAIMEDSGGISPNKASLFLTNHCSNKPILTSLQNLHKQNKTKQKKQIMLRSTFFPLSSSSSSFLHHPHKFTPKLPSTQSALSSISTLQCPQPVRQNPPPTSAYIHLPFCRHRCHYCDFTIIALGNLSPSPENDPRISNYIHLLLREIQSTRSCPKPHPPLQTLFFGGGTPSLIPPKLLSSVIDVISSKFGISPDAEISIEMDPGTFDKKKLDEIVGLGVNRVSLGVQAFQEEMLRGCGRAHGVKEVEEAVEMVNGCDGLENWSLDLISSLPYQREDMWRESLRRAVEVGPTHVSVYDLQVEKGTKFAHL